MNYQMRYARPAAEWKEGLPIGNGRLGGMVCGSAACECVALNHEWLYKGMFRDRAIIMPPANALKEVRELIKQRKFKEATKLANDYFAPTGGDSGPLRHRVDPYQPAGDLYISEFTGDQKILSYERSLDLKTAVQKTVYSTEKGRYTRQIFAYYPLGIIAAEITSEGAELDAEVRLTRVEDPDCNIEYSGRSSAKDGCELEMRGVFNTGVEFKVAAKAIAKGMTVVIGDKIKIKGGHRAVILLNIRTNITDYDAETGFENDDFESLLREHIKNWSEAYDCCGIEIRAPGADRYTDERLSDFKAGGDVTLPILYFNFGRYLLLSSAGDLPPQLQGIWNDRLNPPWDSDFHLDVNLQMNYWPAEVCGLSQTTEPLFAFVERLIPSAKTAAKELYGCRGVCYPIQTDAWSISTPESRGWAVWIGAAAWLALHYMEHYEYTGDIGFLRDRAYPFLRECAEFYEDYLFPGEDGKYVIAPSQSPENRIKDGGEPVSILYNCTSDIEFCEMAFAFAVKAAETLNVDPDKVKIWKSYLEKLPEIGIGPEGELMEFPENFELPEPGHRHLSHLIAVFPGNTITRENRPELFAAAKRSLELRLSHGGGHTGWSRAWVSCLWAVFRNCEKAYEHLKALICDFATVTLLDLHPPRIFQIDGNFGGTAAVANMLIQSCGDQIELLCALPDVWKDGQARGFCAKGGFTLDFCWENGALTGVTVKSKNGGKCRIVCKSFAGGLTKYAQAGFIEIDTKAGEIVNLG